MVLDDVEERTIKRRMLRDCMTFPVLRTLIEAAFLNLSSDIAETLSGINYRNTNKTKMYTSWDLLHINTSTQSMHMKSN